MIEKIRSYLSYRNRYYSIEHTQLNGNDHFYGIVLKRKQKQLDIELSFESGSIEDLKNVIPKGKPVVLAVNTNSVLTKLVNSQLEEPEKLVQLAFPNIKTDDFYYETINQGKNHFVSICRKSYIDEILNNCASKGIVIIDFTLGNLVTAAVAPFVDSNEFHTTNRIVAIEEKQIRNIVPTDKKIESAFNINGLEIKNHEMLCFAASLHTIVKDQSIQSSFNGKKKALHNAYREKRFENRFLKIGLGVLFIALLINFLFFNHYYNEVNMLNETSQALQASKTKIMALNEKVQKKEKMVHDILKSASSKSSFYVDAIINGLPESILLKELNYQPLSRKIKAEKSIENQRNTIDISGQTSNGIMFSRWISQLEAEDWIKKVAILSYEDTLGNTSYFTLKLNINDAEE